MLKTQDYSRICLELSKIPGAHPNVVNGKVMSAVGSFNPLDDVVCSRVGGIIGTVLALANLKLKM